MAATMNGPMGMYKVKPYFDKSAVIDLPHCMYRVKSLHKDVRIEDKPAVGMDEAVHSLEQRQEAIITRLNELKSVVEELSRARSVTTVIPQQPGIKLPTCGVIQDLVIHANPSSPPLSVLVLHHLLSQQYSVLGSCHIHSSINGVESKHKALFKHIAANADRTAYQVAITVIWKDVNGPMLLVSPSIQTAIQGEANIARYLARLLNPSYDSCDIVTATEIDTLIDLSFQLCCGNAKEKAAAVRTINAKLGKGSWLVGDDMTLADIVLWSALHQSGQAQGSSGNVKRWLENCAQNPAFQKAQDFL